MTTIEKTINFVLYFIAITLAVLSTCYSLGFFISLESPTDWDFSWHRTIRILSLLVSSVVILIYYLEALDPPNFLKPLKAIYESLHIKKT